MPMVEMSLSLPPLLLLPLAAPALGSATVTVVVSSAETQDTQVVCTKHYIRGCFDVRVGVYKKPGFKVGCSIGTLERRLYKHKSCRLRIIVRGEINWSSI